MISTDTAVRPATPAPSRPAAAPVPVRANRREAAQRRVLASSMVGNAGYGLLSTITVLYYSGALQLSATRIGLTLTAAGLAAALLGVPAGRLADTRIPARVGAGVSYLLLAVMESLLVLVRSFTLLVVVLTVAAGFEMLARTMRQVTVAGLGGERAAEFRAKVAARANLAMLAGMGASSLVIACDSPAVYRAAIAAACVCTAGQGLLMLAVPADALPGPGGADGSPLPSAGTAPSRWLVLRDLPYLAICGLYAVMTMAECVITVALPLRISQHTQAPTWLVGVFGIANVLAVGLLLTRVGRLVGTPARAGRAMAVGGALNGLFVLLLMLAADRSPATSVALLAAGMLLAVTAQLCVLPAENELTMTLAPARARGQYLGLSETALTTALTLGPAVVTLATVDTGRTGWALLAAAFALAGAAAPAAARAAGRNTARATVEAALGAAPSKCPPRPEG
ncbi:MFS transporter [Kitasatospora sp. NPDC002227]|uniref:MFS transporter n=1 Tax=Kitasatospora sp. NPDC002227 TaxID=3154773 RepID=UPI003329AC84